MANILLVSPSASDISLQPSDLTVSIPASETSVSISKQPNITIIGTTAFLHVSKLLGFSNFELCLHSLDIYVNSIKLAETLSLSNVPSKYHKLTDIFSKTKAEVLAPYYIYKLSPYVYSIILACFIRLKVCSL